MNIAWIMQQGLKRIYEKKGVVFWPEYAIVYWLTADQYKGNVERNKIKQYSVYITIYEWVSLKIMINKSQNRRIWMWPTSSKEY